MNLRAESSWSRRMLCTTALGAAALPMAAAAAVLPGAGVYPVTLPGNAGDALRNFMRMAGTPAGETCTLCEGLLYGRPPDALPNRLVGFRSALIIRCVEESPGVFRTQQREAMHYTDLARGEPIGEFSSPYDGARLTPIGYVSPLNTYLFDELGSRMLHPTDSPLRGPPFDWRTDGNEVWVTESRFNIFPSSITEQEFPRAYSGPERRSVDVLTYSTSATAFADSSISALPARVSLLSDAPWPLWLMRGRAAGGVLWQGFGRKYARFAEMPDAARRAVDSVHAGFLDEPWKFPELEFSTAAQLRRLRAAGVL